VHRWLCQLYVIKWLWYGRCSLFAMTIQFLKLKNCKHSKFFKISIKTCLKVLSLLLWWGGFKDVSEDLFLVTQMSLQGLYQSIVKFYKFANVLQDSRRRIFSLGRQRPSGGRGCCFDQRQRFVSCSLNSSRFWQDWMLVEIWNWSPCIIPLTLSCGAAIWFF